MHFSYSASPFITSALNFFSARFYRQTQNPLNNIIRQDSMALSRFLFHIFLKQIGQMLPLQLGGKSAENGEKEGIRLEVE